LVAEIFEKMSKIKLL